MDALDATPAWEGTVEELSPPDFDIKFTFDSDATLSVYYPK